MDFYGTIWNIRKFSIEQSNQVLTEQFQIKSWFNCSMERPILENRHQRLSNGAPESKKQKRKFENFAEKYVQAHHLQEIVPVPTAADLILDETVRNEWYNEIINPLRNVTDSTIITDLNKWKKFAIESGVSPDDPLFGKIQTENKLKRKNIISNEKLNKLDGTDKYYHDWDEILDMYENLVDLTTSPNFTYTQWQQRLLLSFYIFHPPIRHNFSHCLLYPEPIPSDIYTNYIFKNEQDESIFHLGYDKVCFDSVDSISNRLISSGKGPSEWKLHENVVSNISQIETLFGPRKYLLTQNFKKTHPLEKSLQTPTLDNTLYLLKTIPMKGTQEKSNLNLFCIRSAYFTNLQKNGEMSEAALELIAKQMRTSLKQLRLYYKKI